MARFIVLNKPNSSGAKRVLVNMDLIQSVETVSTKGFPDDRLITMRDGHTVTVQQDIDIIWSMR